MGSLCECVAGVSVAERRDPEVSPQAYFSSREVSKAVDCSHGPCPGPYGTDRPADTFEGVECETPVGGARVLGILVLVVIAVNCRISGIRVLDNGGDGRPLLSRFI